MNGLAETCRCGHDISTHFLDTERPGEYAEGTEPKKFRGRCTGLHCNDCSRYVQAKEGDPPFKHSGKVRARDTDGNA